MPDKRWPNLFIGGAAKSGTTSLWRWLGHHPQVYMSPDKEPRYFCSDLTFTKRVRRQEDYLALFNDAGDQPWRGEASVWYLTSQVAAQRIGDDCGQDVRVIFSLRNPVDMTYSLHSQFLYSSQETYEDFDQALAAEPFRRRGERLPDRQNPREGLYYSTVANYDEQLQRFWDVFGRDRVEVIVFDDLKADPRGTYRRLCQWLDIDPSVEPPMDRHNVNKQVRSRWLREFTWNLPAPFKVITERLPAGVRARLQALVRELNTERKPRPPLSEGARGQLQEAYRDNVERLSEMLDRDLMHWVDQD